MKVSSFNENIEFADKITTKVILESSFSKEIRILLKKGQVMKEHQTPFPIVVQVLQGSIDFGVGGTKQLLTAGGIITLEGNTPHDLTAKADSVVRLTLSKLDKVERVKNVVQSS